MPTIEDNKIVWDGRYNWANRGEELVLESLPLDDRPTFELLSRGDTLGVFQLDGGPMRQRLQRTDHER